MMELRGKYNTAKIFTDNVDAEAIRQIIQFLNQPFAAGSQVRVMPDAHAGASCTVGTTMTVRDKIVPNLVGSDIGCGMETVMLKNSANTGTAQPRLHRAFRGENSQWKGPIDLPALDREIRARVPAGFKVRQTAHSFLKRINLQKLRCAKHIDISRAEKCMGTLGGGNHFIELDYDSAGKLYLVIHSGSRHLGKMVADYYQRQAVSHLQNRGELFNPELAYVEGGLFEDYLHDMEIARHFAELNRQAIVSDITEALGLKIESQFATTHNYIDTRDMILRKGAISAKAGEQALIPLNMRDGGLLCTGKGNADWNYSAPHGAGRLMSRGEAKARIALESYREAMKGIYTTTVNESTVDESPFAYKPADEIAGNVRDTVDIVKQIWPLYNFKASKSAVDPAEVEN
ncbi:MAG: RtcB family protein [Clostridiales bacterium]|nr:RtcB family protein [Clostridiales bacterium]